MPFLHTMIKYAADRGGLAGRVADVGLRAMKKRCVAVLTAALCLMLVLGLQACAGSGGGRPIQDPQAGTVLPEGAKKEEGVVLDASDGQFILRAAGGGEYVFRMDGAEDMVEGGVQAGQYVRIWYDGVLTDTNARNVKLLRIEAAQETQPDSLSMGSTADGVVTAFDEESITLRTAGGETYTFAAGRSVRALKGEPREGMWARVYFDGAPDGAVVSRVTARVSEGDVFTLAGRIRAVDEKADTITFLADTGERYIFALGFAEVDMSDGLRAGSRAVLSYSGSAAPGGYIPCHAAACAGGKAGGCTGCAGHGVFREQQTGQHRGMYGGRTCTCLLHGEIPHRAAGRSGAGRWCARHLFRLHQRGIHPFRTASVTGGHGPERCQ